MQSLVSLWAEKGIDTVSGLRGDLEMAGAQVAMMIDRYGSDSLVRQTDEAIEEAAQQLSVLRAETHASANRSVLVQLVVLGAAVLVAVVMILLVYHLVSKPLRVIVDSAARMAICRTMSVTCSGTNSAS
jgi:nitrate/nitrite-specific signal transduction histidine kinase